MLSVKLKARFAGKFSHGENLKHTCTNSLKPAISQGHDYNIK